MARNELFKQKTGLYGRPTLVEKRRLRTHRKARKANAVVRNANKENTCGRIKGQAGGCNLLCRPFSPKSKLAYGLKINFVFACPLARSNGSGKTPIAYVERKYNFRGTMKNKTMKTACTRLCAGKLLSFLFFFLFCLSASYAQVNRTLDFNGTNAYVSLGTSNPSGNFSTGMTIECWVKWGAFNTWSRLLELGNGPGNNNILFCNEGSTAKLRFEAYQGSASQGVSSATTMVTGRWYHVAVTQTGAGLTTLYVDGIADASATLQMPLNVSRSQCYIGRSSWTVDGYLNGKVDEMRVWNVVRTQAQIRQNMTKSVAANSTGLVAYYQCDEGSGTALVNNCTNGTVVNGTVSGSTWATSPTRTTGNAIGLDGTDDHVSIGAPLGTGNSYTKEAWVYVTKDLTQPQNIISTYGSPLWISSGTLRAGNTGSAPQVTDATSFPANAWVHVAVTYNASTGAMRLYRDGSLVASATVATSSYTGGNTFVGAWSNNGTAATEAYLGGKIDEVRIWNVVRTQSEIQASMSKELDPASEANLVAYYTFNQGLAGGDNSGMVTVPDQKGTNNGTLQNITLTGSSSNFAQQKSTIFVLPVGFASFVAQKQGANVLLQWSIVGGDQASTRFLVEHSRNGRDWRTLAGFEGSSTGAAKDYNYLHTAPEGGMNYYRVAVQENDGKTGYSTVKTISFDDKNKVFAVQNPVVTNNVLHVQVNVPTALSLYTQDGKMIWEKQQAAGLQTISVSNLAKGLYFLTSAGTGAERILVQ